MIKVRDIDGLTGCDITIVSWKTKKTIYSNKTDDREISEMDNGEELMEAEVLLMFAVRDELVLQVKM